jgi:hypothetical protein
LQQHTKKNGASFSLVQREMAGKTACFVANNSADNVEYENHGQCVRTNLPQAPWQEMCRYQCPHGEQEEVLRGAVIA